ncbi:TPA: hypothetical protein DCZ46_04310 [Candidatus Campbellbacteria bacterium]|jgi:hypothetical protein|nr:MAG: seg [Candidatus Campbellbacteria bacterium GW2011_OD1_34_28]KKP75060.1 MAG: hypothetical protein UR74_C0002G0326 [Candidatus Campbellbacteria bacterium GW2011_GWD2_35_24]KKP75946.1 MAG: hypothetical protein UR75_C0002G0327 [Candidatus Campbellbacteria bacterium GW2011_GWC2_35_28]KKP76806.1 MAG: hypothetical protein UR76_C0002G0007 [Candidatus Campbellbacteria bacterium GW2011_GWC1_35_31]KKP78732.1 MAG: hypothetical protein UR79_C0002G0007 [Candidatus Campbellbacteria bacterium GW2011_GW
MSGIQLVLGISKENILFAHSSFTALQITVYASSFIDFSGGGGKNKLRLLARRHADALAEQSENPRPAICVFLYEKTSIVVWNGFSVIASLPAESFGHLWVPPAKHVITSIGDNMPLNGDDLDSFLHFFRKYLV